MKKPIQINLFLYTLFLTIALLGMLAGNALMDHYPSLRVWSATTCLLMLIGLPFVWWQSKAGLPDFIDANVSNKNRFLFPASIGLMFGLADVLVFQVLLHPEPYTTLPPFLQPFPYSLLLYFSGAFEVEIFYRLIPLTITLLAGISFKKGKFYIHFFWVGAILTSLREPIEQLPDEGFALILYSLTTGFAMNLIQAWYFRKAGFLASLSVRLGHYLIWHILLGIYIQWIDLGGI